MVLITRLLCSASLFIAALALPRPDSAINEPAVAAPNGVPITLTETVTSPTAAVKKDWYNNYGSGDNKEKYEGKPKDSDPYKSTATATATAKADSYGNKKKDDWKSKDSDLYKPTATAKANPYDDKKKDDWKPKESDKPPTYGSGHSDWNQGYDGCVQQCQAKYKFPSPTYKPTATQSSSATGAIHTVIVAPTQGVLRYVPFAVNAAVGDTVKFVWGANNHTVTKGSALLPCNKTLDNPFSSGTQNKDFEFDLRINDTQPIYFYCGTPTHCQKGMFAMINPPSNPNAPTSVAGMMTGVAANYSSISTYASYSASVTENKERAAKWGSNIDMGSLPEWSRQYVAENVLYTRSFLGINSETLKDDNSIDLSSMHTTPLLMPKDLGVVLALSGDSTATATPSPASTSYTTTADEGSSTTTTTPALSGSLKSGSIALSSSTIFVTIVAFASFLLQ